MQDSEDLCPSLPVRACSLSAGFSHVALVRNGTIYTWGNAVQGCLGMSFCFSYLSVTTHRHYGFLEFCFLHIFFPLSLIMLGVLYPKDHDIYLMKVTGKTQTSAIGRKVLVWGNIENIERSWKKVQHTVHLAKNSGPNYKKVFAQK